jgi:hypothetical protein
MEHVRRDLTNARRRYLQLPRSVDMVGLSRINPSTWSGRAKDGLRVRLRNRITTEADLAEWDQVVLKRFMLASS